MEKSEFQFSANPPAFGQKDDVILNIYHYLNQGNLFRIYQLMDSISTTDEKRVIEEMFVKRFGFNYNHFI